MLEKWYDNTAIYGIWLDAACREMTLASHSLAGWEGIWILTLAKNREKKKLAALTLIKM